MSLPDKPFSFNFSKRNLNTISKCYFSSHLSQIKNREEEFINKVLASDNYTPNEFSNFLRILNKNKNDKILLKRFTEEMPKHVNLLDDLDTRKAISIVISNGNLSSNEGLVSSLKDRFTEIRKIKNMNDNGEIKIGCNFKKQPMPIRFWISFARLRERFYMNTRKYLKYDLK
jgi:hypothetical protein